MTASNGCRCTVCTCQPKRSKPHSPNVVSVGDTAQVRTWDEAKRAYVLKPVRIRAIRGSWLKFTYLDSGAWGSQEFGAVERGS